jgi:hypothetical protein
MNAFVRTMAAAALAFGLTGAVSAQYLMVSGSSTDFRGVALFDPFDGSLVNSQYFDVSGHTSAVLKHAMQVGNEIWISAQAGATGSRIFRYTLAGSLLGEITEGAPGVALNNIRGMALVGNTVWLTNSGSPTGPALVTFDTNGNWQATHPVALGTSPFSILDYNGQLLVADSGTPDIQRYDYNGNHIGPFHVGAISFVQQMHEHSNGNVLAAGFSPTAGIYEYDPAGNQVGFFAGSGARGVWELGNGNIMWTSSGGVHIWDGASSTTVLSGFNAQYVDFLALPAPGALALLGLAGLVGRRRRRA